MNKHLIVNSHFVNVLYYFMQYVFISLTSVMYRYSLPHVNSPITARMIEKIEKIKSP